MPKIITHHLAEAIGQVRLARDQAEVERLVPEDQVRGVRTGWLGVMDDLRPEDKVARPVLPFLEGEDGGQGLGTPPSGICDMWVGRIDHRPGQVYAIGNCEE